MNATIFECGEVACGIAPNDNRITKNADAHGPFRDDLVTPRRDVLRIPYIGHEILHGRLPVLRDKSSTRATYDSTPNSIVGLDGLHVRPDKLRRDQPCLVSELHPQLTGPVIGLTHTPPSPPHWLPGSR